MDFPKSVPGVGLVGERFADEDPAIGRQGSLIPSAWGNAVTLELLNVIQAAGLNPSEAQTDQLLEAIRALVPERSAFARITGTQALPASAFGIYALADGGAAATVTLPSTADLVDDAELLLFANHANTAAVQVKAGAGQTVQGPAALMGESTTAFMLPAGGDWVRLRSEKAQGRWVVVSAYSAEVAVLRSQLGIAGQAKNLRCWAAGTDALIRVTAEQIFLDSAGGQTIKLRGVDLTINTATVGANGLDTGVLAAGTWYSVWVISDGVNVRGLISLSATAPTMPAGFTYKCQVWDVRTDGTANKFPLAAYKERNKTRYKLGANVAALPLIASGVAGTYANQPAYVSASVVNAVPVGAISIALAISNTEVGAVAAVAPNPNYTNPVLGSCAPLFFSSGGQYGGTFVSMSEMMLESQNIYYVSNGTGNKVVCYGWEDCL